MLSVQKALFYLSWPLRQCSSVISDEQMHSTALDLMILAFKNVISQIDVNVFFSIFEYYKLVKLQN